MRLFQLIRTLRSKFIFRLFYWAVRIGMGLTFVTSGLRKVPGVRFTILPPEDPVGGFFQAMYDTGVFWHFIGFFQIAIGILVFLNRFAPLAIILMLPVTVNIFLVSSGLHMRGTPVITAAMLLGNTFLLLWHYEQYTSIIQKPDKTTTRLR